MQPRKADEVSGAITDWLKDHEVRSQGMPANVKELYEWLVLEDEYTGSYKSVYRYMRATYGCAPRCPYRRIELPAGAQAQADWCERKVWIGGMAEKVYGFWMVLHPEAKGTTSWAGQCAVKNPLDDGCSLCSSPQAPSPRLCSRSRETVRYR